MDKEAAALALQVLEHVVITAVWDRKPYHEVPQMLIPNTVVKQAREILKANDYKHYGSA